MVEERISDTWKLKATNLGLVEFVDESVHLGDRVGIELVALGHVKDGDTDVAGFRVNDKGGFQQVVAVRAHGLVQPRVAVQQDELVAGLHESKVSA